MDVSSRCERDEIQNSGLTRRDAMARAVGAMGLAGAGVLLAGSGRAAAQDAGPVVAAGGVPRKRALRVAHMTDFHVQPEKAAGEGMAAALRHVHALKDKPDLILTGGDLVMDSLDATEARTRTQWDLFTRVLKDECGTPVEHCLGNHDMWGWNQDKSKTTGDEPLYGHKWAMQALGLPGRYRAFERAGWKFVVLDSTFRVGNGYKARLDDGQFEWLATELAATPRERPVLVVSHMPILSVTPYLFGGDYAKSGDWRVPGAWIHLDAGKLKDLFLKHPNVRLCLSGHMHLVDRADYAGVTYLCNGAVCGAWWGGDHHECAPGYAVIDLYQDGSFEHAYVGYGWVARA